MYIISYYAIDQDRLHILKDSEIGWPGIVYREGIKSALLGSNSALCIPFFFTQAINADDLYLSFPE